MARGKAPKLGGPEQKACGSREGEAMSQDERLHALRVELNKLVQIRFEQVVVATLTRMVQEEGRC